MCFDLVNSTKRKVSTRELKSRGRLQKVQVIEVVKNCYINLPRPDGTVNASNPPKLNESINTNKTLYHGETSENVMSATKIGSKIYEPKIYEKNISNPVHLY